MIDRDEPFIQVRFRVRGKLSPERKKKSTLSHIDVVTSLNSLHSIFGLIKTETDRLSRLPIIEDTPHE